MEQGWEVYVEDATRIFNDFKRRMRDPKFAALGREAHLEMYHRNHPAFAKVFPIPLRHMIERGLYSRKAFEIIVKTMRRRPYKSKEEFCRYQADYVKLLYLKLGRSRSYKEAVAYGNETYEALIKEMSMFDEAEQKVKAKHDKMASVASVEKRDELRALIAGLGNA
jgi:hypothetical protein